jgi:1,4-dihydroxy-2-naphthoate octaprenyltransferase
LNTRTAPPGRAPRSSLWTAWWLAIRPKTLTLAVVPVVVGSVLAWSQGSPFSAWVFCAALAVALLIQIGTNLHNDVSDFERGTDRAETRVGPLRVTAAGLLSVASVRNGATGSFAAALLLGSWLAWVGGWPIAVAGVVSIVSGWAYTGGPRPLAYGPWGELFVLVFFGLVAVAGSHYLQSGRLDPAALLTGVVLGLPAAAVLAVNNTRDRDNDARTGRRTLAVLYGTGFARLEYWLLLLGPFPLLVWLWDLPPGGWGVFLPWLLLPVAFTLMRRFSAAVRGALPMSAFNPLLAATARFQVGLGGLLALGLALGMGG